MKALGWWLIAVGTLRLASVWFSFFDIWALKLAVFSNTTMKQRWSEPAIKGSPPTPRDSHSCTVVGDNLFVFGGTYGTNMLNDLHILDTWMAREIEQRLEKLSLRKHLKQKCLEQNLNLVQTPVLCGYGMSADSNQPMGILNFSQLRRLNIPVNQSLPPGKKTFQAKVTERMSGGGFTIETVVDGKPLQGILFANKPPIFNSVPNTFSSKSPAVQNVTTSDMVKQTRMEDRQELWGGSSESHERHKEADTSVISSTPTTVAESFKATVIPEPETVSLNQNRDGQNEIPKSLVESSKNDAPNDLTSSKGEFQTSGQVNVPVSSYEIPRQTSEAPNCSTDLQKPAAAESVVCLPNQGVTGDCTTPRTERHSEAAKLT